MEKSSKFQTFENLFKNSITAKESSLKLRLHELFLANVPILTPLKTLFSRGLKSKQWPEWVKNLKIFKS